MFLLTAGYSRMRLAELKGKPTRFPALQHLVSCVLSLIQPCWQPISCTKKRFRRLAISFRELPRKSLRNDGLLHANAADACPGSNGRMSCRFKNRERLPRVRTFFQSESEARWV